MMTTDSSQLGTSRISQAASEKIARHFNLLFNQATIYHGSHPAIAAGILPFFQSLREGLAKVSPLTVMLERDSLFIEEWCIDKRVNLRKIVNHFKKAGIQSISFSGDLVQEEVLPFLIVMCDIRTYPTVEMMREGLFRNRVASIRLNYVIYKKMTTDDEVVAAGGDAQKRATTERISFKELHQILDEGPTVKESVMAKVVLDELERSLSLKQLLEDPAKFSKELLKVSSSQEAVEKGLQPGMLVAQKLRELGNEIRSAPLGAGFENLESMMQAVYKMRAELLEEIEAQKAMGVIYKEEGLIHEEAKALTREVIIRLIREEYNQGQISIKRLAQILRRMLPDVKELRRILPDLKAALLADGMPLSDFLKLIKELALELQNEGLVQVLQEAAEEIGITIEDLIVNIKEDPRSAAELIVLAAEIRNGGATGDEKVLTDLLVDYVERVGNHMAMESARAEGFEGGKHLQKIVRGIQRELMGQLRAQPLKDEVVSAVDHQLNERLGGTLGQLKSSWVLQQLGSGDAHLNAAEVVRVLENTLEHERELEEILEPIRDTLKRQGMAEPVFDQIYKNVFSRLEQRHKRKQWGDLPNQTFNRRMTLFLLNWEIQRSTRYSCPFSGILICIRQIEFQRTITLDIDLDSPEIRNEVLETLRQSIRCVDIVGTLGENRIFLLFPMTPIQGARVVLERIKSGLRHRHFRLQGIPANVEFCLTAIGFDRHQMPDVDIFVEVAERSLQRVMESMEKKK